MICRAQAQETNRRNCSANIETLKRDLELFKDYKTTTEVNIARVRTMQLHTAGVGIYTASTWPHSQNGRLHE